MHPHSQQVVSLSVIRDLCDTTPVQAEALQALAGLDSVFQAGDFHWGREGQVCILER